MNQNKKVTLTQDSKNMTVNVRYFYATVADTTVGTSWRPVKSTGRTPFHTHLYGVHLCRLVQWGLEIVASVFVFWC